MDINNTPIDLVEKRNALLQDSLRENENLPFSISEECPIILNKNHLHTSYFIGSSTEVFSHISLWQREWTNTSADKSFKVGLIANVATSKKHRGKGYSKKLISYADDFAKEHHLDALVLWSDLTEFYQTQGFMAQGKEFRYWIRKGEKPRNFDLSFTEATTLSENDLEVLLTLRPKTGLCQKRSIKRV